MLQNKTEGEERGRSLARARTNVFVAAHLGKCARVVELCPTRETTPGGRATAPAGDDGARNHPRPQRSNNNNRDQCEFPPPGQMPFHPLLTNLRAGAKRTNRPHLIAFLPH